MFKCLAFFVLLFVLLLQFHQFRLERAAFLRIVCLDSVDSLSLLLHLLFVVPLEALICRFLLAHATLHGGQLFFVPPLGRPVLIGVPLPSLLFDLQVLRSAALENAELLPEEVLAPEEVLPLAV